MVQIAIIPEPKKILAGEEGHADPVIRERKTDPDMGEEEYCLQLKKDGIWIAGGSEKACLYAESTLEQIRLQCGDALPCLTVEDCPAYSWRAFHIDCARHFIPADELKKMIRMSAHFKLNKFHWHFSDDQGWRIECRKFPLLHEIGAVRRGDHMGNYDSDETEDRYYTREQVREIVAYCGELGVEVIPEVDMPGHVTAVLAAYPQYGCRGEQILVETRAGIFRDILCAGKEETFVFIEQLLDDLLELFPGKYFHIGGDEAPKEYWSSCPLCRKRMEEEGLENLQQLQGYMENRITAYLKAKGRTVIVWNEAAYGGNLDPDTIVQLWTDDKENRLEQHMERGGKAVISIVKNCYCDYPYGITSLRDVYELEECPAGLTKAKDRILGTECLIWTEHVRDEKRLETLCWPRFAASAEVGWRGQDRPGYPSFETRMKRLLPVFKKYGICPEEAPGWVPAQEEAKRQKAEFEKNFSAEDRQEVEKMQEII